MIAKTPHETETTLRHRLGIPHQAERVIIFAESSHWDPNWVETSETYYRRFVEPNLARAIAELEQEPRRVYSVECVFFLRIYWDRRPDQHDAVRRLINEGRLRMTSSGVTTADTILPSAEAILRDLLIGQEWLRARGMTWEPRLAYFTDSFGCSPALPSLLKSAGVDMTAITRIDGMYFPGCDFELPGRFPRPGSSAELLLEQERTLDFVWRGPDGAEVLCHWNAFTYGQGDMLAHRGIMRIYLFPLAIADRSARHVARRIDHFAAQLAPYGRTPYLFCPIGFDFVDPLPDLVGMLDRYNRTRYPETGLWAVNAGLDDYLTLVDCHREQLPVLELDPNPYWTGFYTARPSLKGKCFQLVDLLLRAERLALLPENDHAVEAINSDLESAWWEAAVANHHDFITGTSPDEVVEEEQLPWLEQATATVNTVVGRLTPIGTAHRPAEQPQALPEWRLHDGALEIATPHYEVTLAQEAGGGIVRARAPGMDSTWLDEVSNDLICYQDAGGLWRMGHEFAGGHLKEIARASEGATQLEVVESDAGLEVACETEFDGLTICRRLWFRSDDPTIRGQIEGHAADRRTITVRFPTPILSEQLVMDQPGGVVARPPRKIYDPTFWPLQRFVHLQDEEQKWGIAFSLGMPGAVSYQRGRYVELIALRNATRERAFGFLPLPANPATGHERSRITFDYAVRFTPGGDWRDNRLYSTALSHPAIVTTDRDDVTVSAVKPASRGMGLIVRLSSYAQPESKVAISAPGRTVRAAFLCDARERDLKPLDVRDGAIHLTMPGTIATVRLLE